MLVLSLLWAMMRAVMFLFLELLENKTQMVYRILLWAPLVFCILAYSLLVVHWGHVLHFETWKVSRRARGDRDCMAADCATTQERTRKYFASFYCALNGVFFIGHVILVVLGFVHPSLVSGFVRAVSSSSTGATRWRSWCRRSWCWLRACTCCWAA